MTRRNNAIARLVFMKLCTVTMAVIQDCKSMRKTVFIAKLVILKIQRRILCGSAQRAAAGQITQICEAVLPENKTNYTSLIGRKYPWSVFVSVAMFLAPSACQTQQVTSDHAIVSNKSVSVSVQAGHFLAARQADYFNDVASSAEFYLAILNDHSLKF